MAKAKFDVQQEVTDRIIKLMEENGTDWVKPFAGGAGLPVSMSTGKNYRGINVFLLWSAPFSDNRWGTYKAWAAKDAQVKKGERASRVAFWNFGEDKNKKKFAWVKYSSVFNAEQVEGAPEVAGTEQIDETERNALADEFIKSTQARIEHSNEGRAYYRPSGDLIHMPDRELFSGTDTATATETYYGTLLHELTHWTGAEHRLDRMKGSRFGDPDYAYEELVAEMGSAMLSALLGVSVEPRADHAQYLNNWLKALKNDPKFIMSAASKAGQAMAHLQTLQPGYVAPVEEEAGKVAA